jgi:hypothetical protein
MESPNDLEKIKKLDEAADCMEFVNVIGIEFPIYPDGLELPMFMNFGWDKLKTYEFSEGETSTILFWIRCLKQYRKNGSFGVPVKQKSLPKKFDAEEMLEKTKNSHEFTKLIKNLKQPNPQDMIRSNCEDLGIFSAVYLGKDEIIRSLIAKDPTCVNKKNRYGWTPLHYVMCIGCSDAATILVQFGADPTISNDEGVLPMILGAKWGHRATVNNTCQALVAKRGAKYVKDLLRIPDSHGRHPLHYAAESKQHVVCDVMLGFGADPNHPDCSGQTPTFLACKTGNLDTIRIVHLKWGGNIRLADKKKKTPFDAFPKDKNLLEQLKMADNQMEES